MHPRLTIAIPTVNRAEFLGRAIECAYAQTSKDIEILVSDNGSRDETPEIIARYVGSSRVDLQACKLEYSIVSPK